MDIKFDNDAKPTINYNKDGITVIDNVLTEYECSQIRDLIIEEGSKIISSEILSKIIEERCDKIIPKLIYEQDNELPKHNHDNNNQYWYRKEISDDWKLYKRCKGGRLSKHFDAVTLKSVDYKSMFSLLLYLVDSDGCTKFENGLEIEPKAGRVLYFKLDKLHEGLENKNNTKYFIRSKIMYERQSHVESPIDTEATKLYIKSLNTKNNEEFSNLQDAAFKMSPLLERTVLSLL